MGVLRSVYGFAAAALLLGLVLPGEIARAQSPAPMSRVDQNTAILKPLTEIGRVRARTPYCAALAKARPGIDAAISFEYAVPVVAEDLRSFRFDSYLTKERSSRKTESDLRALWLTAQQGRTEVQALRDAANAPGVDPDQKKEMLAFANALDGAKARQMWLAKTIARNLAVLLELPVRQMLDQASDDHGSSALETTMHQSPTFMGPTPPPAQTETTSDAIADAQQTQRVFDTFTGEEPIRADLKNASEHGTLAMQLGGCSSP
jgi:hypothetical protein